MTISFASAEVNFSEIMYDPEGSDSSREWIEIRNDGDAVNLTSYKFFESNVNHGITAFQGGNTVPSGGFAVIADNPARFLQDYPAFSGLLFDSSFSLSNAGEYLAMKDGGGAITDSFTYTPSAGGQDDSTTLSLVSTAWVRGEATPGAANVVSTLPISVTSTTTSITAKTSPPAPDLTVFLPEQSILIAGAEKQFMASAVQSSGVEPSNMTYEWSFGDGGVRSGKTVSYRYQEPGHYTVVVEAGNGNLFSKNRVKVQVVDGDLAIHNAVKTEDKIVIGVKNNSPYELDMSFWKVSAGPLHYTIPKNTIISPRSTLMLNGLELGMSTSTVDLSTTSLRFPGGKLLASSTRTLRNIVDRSVQPRDEAASKKIEKNTTTIASEPKSTYKALSQSTKEKEMMKHVLATSTSSIIKDDEEIKRDQRISSWIKSLFTK
jgi:hypothetical protein